MVTASTWITMPHADVASSGWVQHGIGGLRGYTEHCIVNVGAQASSLGRQGVSGSVRCPVRGGHLCAPRIREADSSDPTNRLGAGAKTAAGPHTIANRDIAKYADENTPVDRQRLSRCRLSARGGREPSYSLRVDDSGAKDSRGAETDAGGRGKSLRGYPTSDKRPCPRAHRAFQHRRVGQHARALRRAGEHRRETSPAGRLAALRIFRLTRSGASND